MRRVLAAVALLALASLLVVAVIHGAAGYYPTAELRGLAKFYLWNMFNPVEKVLWAGSPEAVNAILWDYRGLDTVFETSVLYVAVLGCLVLAKGLPTPRVGGRELTPIVSTGVKLVIAMIILASISLALHGYVSPGGGFQGGSALAIAPLLAIAAYSWTFLRRRLWVNASVLIRSAGLLGISVAALLPLALAGYVMQNQWKPWSGFPGFPAWAGKFFLGGSLVVYNVSEFLVVSSEFVLVFIALTLITSSGGDEGG